MIEKPNMSYIHQISDGDKEFETKLLRVIKKELPEEAKIYSQNISKKNYLGAASNVHKIKHKIIILGLPKSHEFADNYENKLRSGIAKEEAKFEKILQQMLIFIDKH